MLIMYVSAESSFNHIDGITIRFRGWMIGIYWKSKIKTIQNAGERRRSFGGGGDVRWHPGRDSGWPFSSGLPHISWKIFLLINCFAQCTIISRLALLAIRHLLRDKGRVGEISNYPLSSNWSYSVTL